MRSRASAYALYVLAKGGRGDLPRLRWWHDVQMKYEASPLAMAQIGAGLAMMGDQARARDALQHAAAAVGYKRPLLQRTASTTDWYQSPLRDLAGVIALAYEAGEPDIARGLQGRLDGAVKDPDSLNTQEKARLLQAAHFMLQAAGPDPHPGGRRGARHAGRRRAALGGEGAWPTPASSTPARGRSGAR